MLNKYVNFKEILFSYRYEYILQFWFIDVSQFFLRFTSLSVISIHLGGSFDGIFIRGLYAFFPFFFLFFFPFDLLPFIESGDVKTDDKKSHESIHLAWNKIPVNRSGVKRREWMRHGDKTKKKKIENR